MSDKEKKIAVAMCDPLPGDVPTVLLGIPAGAWEFMQDGKTHTFDLTQVGIPVKILMFGAADRDGVMKLMNQAAVMATGSPMENDPNKADRDLGIKDPTVQ